MNVDRLFADTSLFLRYLTNDVPGQADAFEHMLRQAARGDFTFVTNGLVIAEIIWTLESYYQIAREEIQSKVLAILNTPGLDVEDGKLVLQATLWYVEKRVDFIDAYNAAWMLNQGVRVACTFDRKHFSRFDGLSVQVPGE